MRRVNLFKRVIIITALGITLCGNMLPTDLFAASKEVKTAYDIEIEESKETQEEIALSVASLKEQVEALSDGYSDIELYILSIDNAYADAYKEYGNTCAELESVKLKVAEAEKVSAEKSALEREKYQIMSDRIRYMYEGKNVSFADVLLGADSISDLLNLIEYRTRISDYDNEIYTEYLKAKEEALKTEELLNARLSELSALNSYQTETLNAMETMAQNKKNEIVALTEKYGIDEDTLYYNWDKIMETGSYAETEEVFEEISLTEEENYLLENMMWPLPERSYISSYFGYREAPTKDAQTYHRGIDIPANTGTPVRAALSGTVVAATYEYSSGNFVKIDHGNGLYTVYCHASELLCKVGDEVKKGQTIMYVGTTGVSTGPHLHFGVILNSKYVDPLEYIWAGKE